MLYTPFNNVMEKANPITEIFKISSAKDREEFLHSICSSHPNLLCALLKNVAGNKCGIKRLKAIKKILDETL